MFCIRTFVYQSIKTYGMAMNYDSATWHFLRSYTPMYVVSHRQVQRLLNRLTVTLARLITEKSIIED